MTKAGERFTWVRDHGRPGLAQGRKFQRKEILQDEPPGTVSSREVAKPTARSPMRRV